MMISSCKGGKDSEPSIEEVQFKLLSSKTWTISQVSFGSGNLNKTSEYSGMTLKFEGSSSGGTYTVTGRPTLSPWPASGNWEFDANDPENIVIRLNDTLPMTYSVTAAQLQLTFVYSGAGFAGRAAVVEGSGIVLFH